MRVESSNTQNSIGEEKTPTHPFKSKILFLYVNAYIS